MAKPIHYHLGNFPPKEIEWEQLIPLLGPANAAVARYDGTLAAVVNPAVMMSPLTTQEAVLSSRIEGTQATMAEVLEFEAKSGKTEYSEQKKGDINEILNYRKALRHAEEMLKTLPLCLRIIREAHAILLDNVRGEGKSPGEFRTIPNWIGPAGCTIDEATYVPIDAGTLTNALSVWERYLHEDAPDRLVQLAVLHAEFEALHPFLDGNGRLGRMIVPLFIWQTGLIRCPMFYISSFLEANREEYYERLLAVSRDGNWTGWCRFFLQAIKTQAEDNLAKTTLILDLYSDMQKRIAAMTRSPYAVHALDWIFSTPIFKSTDFGSHAHIPPATARRILSILRKEGIVGKLEEGSGQKAPILVFSKLLNVAEGRDVF
ncbi:MAG: Fic family protein [bacterium]